MSRQTSRRSVLKRGGALAALATIPVSGAVAAEEAATGTLRITVYGEEVVDGELVADPLSGIDVYDDDGESGFYGEELGETDENGQLETTIDAGQRSLVVRNQFTRYYDATDRGIEVDIEADATTEFDYYFLPDPIRVVTDYQTEFGKALYLTGETEYLGNWQEATKLTYNDSVGQWVLQEQLPVGAEYKLVRADWTDQETISTAGVDWEVGENRVLPDRSGSLPYAYEEVSPTF